MTQILSLVQRLLTLIPKKWRGTVFAVSVLALVAFAVLDAYNVGPVDGWIAHAARVAGIAAGVIALANLRDPGEGDPDDK
ncbi:hypothetical protein [Glycomyces paridis]|uniref:Holin n=1 Tax=Glycomyces paridis TaxID=2126555 RepID=A0A4S8P6W8_9ACTN|nr:hypothetical protein [Glycomyces paridis]THV26017.1 hypothetical protein E9998_20005 [Glycomyces paridis]